MRLVDYVVVHELVHLRHPGHGREYWQAVGRVLPDYERAAKTCANAVSAWRGKLRRVTFCSTTGAVFFGVIHERS